MRILLFMVFVLFSCTSNPPKVPDKSVFEKYQCEQENKQAKESGKGTIRDCY